MESIKKSSNRAVKIANALRVMAIVGLVFAVLGAICGFAMNGYINQYYSDPQNLAAAQGSLNADMGIFSIINFESIKDAGNYGVFFALQLLCFGVTLIVYIYLFSVLKKTMINVRDTGRAFAEEEAPKYRKSFIILTIILLLFSGLGTAIVAGIILCGLYNVTVAGYDRS